jgi:hypothetical protein
LERLSEELIAGLAEILTSFSSMEKNRGALVWSAPLHSAGFSSRPAFLPHADVYPNRFMKTIGQIIEKTLRKTPI